MCIGRQCFRLGDVAVGITHFRQEDDKDCTIRDVVGDGRFDNSHLTLISTQLRNVRKLESNLTFRRQGQLSVVPEARRLALTDACVLSVSIPSSNENRSKIVRVLRRCSFRLSCVALSRSAVFEHFQSLVIHAPAIQEFGVCKS